MPPVLGPRSPSNTVLWSCAPASGRMAAPSVTAKKDASSPSMNSSTTTLAPAAPKAPDSRQRASAASASGSVQAK